MGLIGRLRVCFRSFVCSSVVCCVCLRVSFVCLLCVRLLECVGLFVCLFICLLVGERVCVRCSVGLFVRVFFVFLLVCGLFACAFVSLFLCGPANSFVYLLVSTIACGRCLLARVYIRMCGVLLAC